MNTAAELTVLGVHELLGHLQRRRVSAREIIDAHLASIERQDTTLGAWVEVFDDLARAAARAIDDGRVRGVGFGPLAGVPVAVKDNIETAWGGTRHGSRVFAHHRAGDDATVVARLRRAGAIILGKTATPEFALAAVTESELHGLTRNPWNPTHSPGGSSGGSAVAVAAGMATLGLGNDGGGSIRLPAACCGVVGLKPARGRLPWGPTLREFWNGLTTHGVLARSAVDAAWTLRTVAGAEPEDPYAPHPLPVDPHASVWQAPRGLRVGVLTDGTYMSVDPQIRVGVRTCADWLAELGHEVVDHTPDLAGLREAFLTLGACGFAAGFPEGHEHEAEEYSRRTYAHGLQYSGRDYAAAVAEVRGRSAAIAAVWRDIDVLLTPTMSVLAPPLAEGGAGEEQWTDYLGWAQFTFPFNLTGQPAVSIPVALADNRLPVGAQLVGAPGREDVVLAVAAQLEWARPRPLPVTVPDDTIA